MRQFKCSSASLTQARDLLADAPDLAAEVESCTESLASAYEQLQDRREQSKRKAKDAERVAEYSDAISAGEMTQEEALQKAIEQEREQKEILKAHTEARRTGLQSCAHRGVGRAIRRGSQRRSPRVVHRARCARVIRARRHVRASCGGNQAI